MSVSAALVKQLRERSGAGMMACKEALSAEEGDIEAALDYLRKKGLGQAAKKAGRATQEGAVAVLTDEPGAAGVLVELSCETDFVARTEQFQSLARDFASTALDTGATDAAALEQADGGDGGKVADRIAAGIAELGENMRLARVARLEAPEGKVFAYAHNRYSEGVGRIGVLAAVSVPGGGSNGSNGARGEALNDFGQTLAMHIAFAAPLAVAREGIDEAAVARERGVQEEIVAAQGKPPEIAAKMVEGKMRRFFQEKALLEQPWVKEPKQSVRQVLQAQAAGAEISGFARFVLGEGGESGAGGANGADGA